MSLTALILRPLLAVVIGGIIGSERAYHGRAAGMRTHILVCLGAALTSMTSIYVTNVLGNNGDIFRISAQVISGVGFLGAGVIILKNNNIITGLTTAAGVWTTGAIGVALGYGFYAGAAVVSVLLLLAIIMFAKFERKTKPAEVIYIEIDDMYRTNAIICELQELIGEPFTFQTLAPTSGNAGHLGLHIIIEKSIDFPLDSLCAIDNVVFAVENL